MKNKIKKIQIFRFVTQIAFLFILPGLFTLTFGQLKGIYTTIIKGNFNFLQILPNLIELIPVILLTVLIGRFFCGWFCAFGAFNDFIHIISKKVFKINFTVDEKADKILKYVKYVILLIIIIVSWTMGSKVFQSASPWDAFGQITNFPQVLLDFTLGIILLLLIAVGAVFIERFFCRYLCPLGAIFAIISKLSLFNIKKPNDKCGKCRLCTNNCSMGLPLYTVNAVRGGECINCLKCVETCPRKNTVPAVVDAEINPALASSVAVAAFVGVYSVSNAGAGIINKNNLAAGITSSTSATSAKYLDGTYTGTASGFRPGLEVQVTISSGKISKIEVVKSNDTPGYFEQAFNTVQNEIISEQSTSVDTVSGATFSSKGIINAVKNALDKAVKGTTTSDNSSNSSSSGTQTENTTNENNSSSTNTDSNATAQTNTSTSTSNNQTNNTKAVNSNNSTTTATTVPTKVPTQVATTPATQSTPTTQAATSTPTTQVTTKPTTAPASTSTTQQYKDGTYTGTANGYRPGLQVAVTIKSGKISNIEIVQINDTPRFYQEPVSVIPGEIIQAQSTNVDTVSGATYSSRGIINAVSAALQQAKA